MTPSPVSVRIVICGLFVWAWASLAAPLHVPTRAHRVQRMTQTVKGEYPDLGLVVFSLQQSDRRILLRVGYMNTGQGNWDRPVDAPQGDVILQSSLQGKKLKASHIDAQLRRPTFPGGLRPREAVAGTLQFELADGDEGAWLRGAVTLVFEPFLPLSFQIDDQAAVEPLEMGRLTPEWDMAATMRPAVEALAFFPMRVGKTAILDDRIVMELGFRNASRYPLKWTGTLGASQARLLTEEAELLRPVNVSESIVDRIAPSGKIWKAQQENKGTVSFALPHPMAAQRLSLLMPGYEPLTLVFDQKTTRWSAAPRAHAADAMPSPVDLIQIEQQVFDEVVDVWKELTQKIAARSFDGFLQAFAPGNVRDAQRQFVEGAKKLPVTQIEFSVPPYQKLHRSTDGIRDLWVELRWLVAGLPRDNEFVTRMQCDMRRVKGGGWEITKVVQAVRPAFWTIGFTQMHSSDHFIVFSKPGEAQTEKAKLAMGQLEKSWSRLRKTLLPLGQRYLAFAVEDKEDFKVLTGRDAETFAGATSAAFAERDGELRVINQAVYINDFRFFSMQRLWAKQDRQVTIQHELAHLALAPQTRPWTPSWLIEGLAMFFAKQSDSFTRDALRQQVTPDLRLSKLSSIPYLGQGAPDAARVMLEYQYSGEAVRWLEKQHGEKGLLTLYKAFADARPEDWDDPSSTEALQSPDADPFAERREAITRAVISERFDGLTLEEMDTAVRQEIGVK
ncbi:MAG: hypothetical protein KDK97_02825 [Verrucomicrobiales bacterium]|nr:hypothetical protein [Verrucomicrobiales bacterium]MCP5556489.1 hypothetical protein [Verrucomicrobiaceae bacterium]